MGWMIRWASTKSYASAKQMAAALGFAFARKKQPVGAEQPSNEGDPEPAFVDEAHCPFKRKKLLW